MTKGKQGYEGSDDYIASKPLMEIVNVSIILSKPLVIKGEPGTGKTLLAHSIQKALGKKLLIWNIKSSTRWARRVLTRRVPSRLAISSLAPGASV